MRALVVVGFAGLVALGCEEKKPAPSATESAVTPTGQAASTTQAAPTTPVVAAAVQAPAAGQVPTEENYEDKAETTITAANADQELNKLEKEIGP